MPQTKTGNLSEVALFPDTSNVSATHEFLGLAVDVQAGSSQVHLSYLEVDAGAPGSLAQPPGPLSPELHQDRNG